MKSFTEHIGRHRTRFPPSHGESITLRTRRNETASRVTAAHAPRAQHPSPHGNTNAHTDRDHPKAETQKTKEMDRTSKRPPPSSLSLPSPLAAIVGGCSSLPPRRRCCSTRRHRRPCRSRYPWRWQQPVPPFHRPGPPTSISLCRRPRRPPRSRSVAKSAKRDTSTRVLVDQSYFSKTIRTNGLSACGGARTSFAQSTRWHRTPNIARFTVAGAPGRSLAGQVGSNAQDTLSARHTSALAIAIKIPAKRLPRVKAPADLVQIVSGY